MSTGTDRRPLTVRQRMAERQKAKEFAKELHISEVWQLRDDLVLGDFDWRDWGFQRRPTSCFMNALNYELTLIEEIASGSPTPCPFP